MEDTFTTKSSAMRKWLFVAFAAGLSVVVLFPPAFWLCGVGVALLGLGSITNSARTNHWMSWQNEGSLSWFEGWAAATGAVLTVLPLFAIHIRSWRA